VSAYFNIPVALKGSESSIYAGSSLNMRFDAANGPKDASACRFPTVHSLLSQGPGFEIPGGAQQRDLIAFQFERDILKRN